MIALSLHVQALLVQFSNASFECGELHGVEGSEAAGWRERYKRLADVRERLESYIGELEAGKVEGGVGASDLAADRERDAGKPEPKDEWMEKWADAMEFFTRRGYRVR